MIGQKLAQDVIERQLTLGWDEGGGMGEALEDLWGLPPTTEGPSGQAAVWRGPSGGACIALIAAGQGAHAGIQLGQRGGLGQECRGQVGMEPLSRRRFQPPRGLDRTQRRDGWIIIRRQLKSQPDGKLLMQKVGLGAGVRQLDRHPAEITAGQHDVDMVAVGVGVARRKPAVCVGINGQA